MKILLILLVSINCFALTKEQIKAINEQNTRAMQSAHSNGGTDYVNYEAPAESEVVTEKEFKKHQKVQKKKQNKVPFISIANDYVNDPKFFMGKKFKVLVIGDTMIAAHGDSSACAFTYLKLVDDTGFEKEMGKGQYYFQSMKGIGCKQIMQTAGEEMSAVTLIVQFAGLGKMANNPSKMEPLFNIVGIE
jgi:hypothetical protein